MPTGAPEVTIRAATSADTAAVLALLSASALPLDGVPDVLTDLLVAERLSSGAPEIVGAVAFERYGDAALLRSTVVAPRLRGAGLGERLVHAALDLARAHAVRDVVLLTTTAAEWFPRFGFTRITRDEAPLALHASNEFQYACPASATVMRLRV
ncbi:MAG: arsenic resistance N-acetyltransferase ArsN2 [Gemmatimonadota bacterium]|nr:arsenic resistance N-acetyltransferase ArsN2 [Gemmatimonadota bacterium]